MAKKLNGPGASHAASLIKEGKIEDSGSWSAPSADAENSYIDKHGMAEFSKWFMGKNDEAEADKKGHWAYPFSSDFEKTNLRGLRAIITRAAQAGAKDIEERAQSLYDEAKKKLGKDKERTETAVSKIFKRKVIERLGRAEPFQKATVESKFTANDVYDWLCDELDNVRPPGVASDCCCWLSPCNFIMPPHEEGEVWQAIVNGTNGKLYMVDFKLGDYEVKLMGELTEVTSADKYVVVDQLTEEADDEASNRSEADKKARKGKPGRHYRYFDADESDFDDTNQEINVSFASELPGLQRCGGSDGEPMEFERAAGLKAGEVYVEILDHGDPDYTVLNNSGAVLDEHDDKDHIGGVKTGTARLDKTNLISRARLKIDDHDKGKMRFRQMKSRSRPHLSAGYKYTGYAGKELLPNGRVAHRFKWKGLEISSVAVPMDGTIGVGRNYKDLPEVDSPTNTRSSNSETKDNTMTEAEEKAAKEAKERAEKEMEAKVKAAEEKGRAEAEAKLRKEMDDKIITISGDEKKRYGEICATRDELITSRPDLERETRKLADEFLQNGTAAKDFKLRAMSDLLKAKPARQNTMADIGMRGEEYDMVKAVQNIIIRAKDRPGITEPDPDTREGQASLRMRKLMEKEGVTHADRQNGFLVPADAVVSTRGLSRSDREKLVRDSTMQATIFGQGGAAVATELLLPIVEILRNRMVTTELGVTPLTGLEGNIAIPRQTAASTAYALPETGALTLSGQILDQIVLAPHKVGAWNAYSRQLLLQSSLDLENFMRTDMFAVMALTWDYYILNGQGAGDQPTGILQSPGVLLVNGNGQFTGYSGDNAAPAWVDIVNFETQIAAINARPNGRAWATTSTAKGRLKSLARLLVGATTVPSVSLWEDGTMGQGMMNGYPAVDSQQIPNNQLMFGVWAENVIHALWGGLNIIVDPYTGANQSIVKIFMDTFGDVAIRHPQEFCISLASAAA